MINPVPSERVAPHQPPGCEDSPLCRAKLLDRFHPVHGARGKETACRGDQRRQLLLVRFDE